MISTAVNEFMCCQNAKINTPNNKPLRKSENPCIGFLGCFGPGYLGQLLFAKGKGTPN